MIDLPNGQTLEESGDLYDISIKLKHYYKYPIIAAKIDRQIYSLKYYPKKSLGKVKFIDYKHPDGQRIYQRSLVMLLLKAVNDLNDNQITSIEHSLGKGIYCQIHEALSHELVQLRYQDIINIENHMNELVKEDLSFEKIQTSLSDAQNYFNNQNRQDMSKLLTYRQKDTISMYRLDDYKDYLFGVCVPSTKYLSCFKLKHYMPGLILQYPDNNQPDSISNYTEQPRLFEIFRESQKWNKVLGVTTLTDVNECIEQGKIQELILVNEGLHEKKITKIADHITDSKDRIKIILIAGPSSSGKTSFADRLRVQLKVNGIQSVPISVDNYFVNRENTPLHADGTYNFESIAAIDIEQFNNDLMQLIQGSAVSLPRYNFKTGKREYRGQTVKLEPNQPLIIEGIHCLNEVLTEQIPKGNKYKIYVSALTSLNFDRHNRIPTADLRLLRRIVRDHQYRGNTAQKTINMWQSVRRGEDEYIFPFQEEADVMFNSTLIYEIPLLKNHAEELLKSIPYEANEYVEAQRLLRFLSFAVSISEKIQIPCTSIIKEFLGDSCLKL
ncbi:hypothetical protein BHF68_09845 [Desulfuribacillus alkaliarsenatis]|uniref:Phosphoribulokinase/uridine kinase domain-containing protein n=1 Tax=Desulfuribacillus alkaliarsenatis TaxID=766136 RepID=A0A1E5FZZ0_9FIRM|nr:hypothetical protein BHF68_09845 [Desulfuribacillus alkaliarsenatis]